MMLSTEALARAAARHPWRVIVLWLVTIAAALAAVGTLLGGKLTSEQRLTNNPKSYVATNLADDHFRSENVDDTIVVRSERYTADSPPFRAFVLRLLERSRATHRVQRMRSYVTSGDRSLVSRDRHATLIPIVMGNNPESGIKKVVDVVRSADRDPAFSVGITGKWTIGNDFNTLAERDLREGEFRYGAPAALFILALVFGALVAAGLPLALALVAIAVALGLTTLIAQAVQLSIFVVNMLTAIGLALGIDYTLFVLSRYREERARGRAKEDAIAAVGATASRAVFFSGSAFAIALVGMLL